MVGKNNIRSCSIAGFSDSFFCHLSTFLAILSPVKKILFNFLQFLKPTSDKVKEACSGRGSVKGLSTNPLPVFQGIFSQKITFSSVIWGNFWPSGGLNYPLLKLDDLF